MTVMTSSAEIDTRAYRTLIGRFATGVTVVTVNHAGTYRAMTANSVTSVSLDPLLLLVCVDKQASMHEALHDAGAFAVNILRADQRSMSDQFSRHGEFERPMGGVPFRPGRSGAPLLDGALGWLDCEVWREYDGGDHTIFVGRVTDLRLEDEDGSPLLFYAGRYRALGPEL
jgi:flavin reductase (DIM6/NTAB) family NADH-FMN oxidoreductase RutF